jgi:hypothetical protein
MDSTSFANQAPSGINEIRHSQRDREAYAHALRSWEASEINIIDKLEAFPRFSTKRSMARFIVKHEIFKKILRINGSVIECGVFNGAGLFAWATLSEIYEPVNYTRKIIGFDTFGGFPSVSEQDNLSSYKSKQGDFCGDTIHSIQESILKHDLERSLGHIPKVELVKGDFMKTGGLYLEKNPHTLISLLYLDFDLYEPTMEALRLFVPRMCAGSIIAFDELNCSNFPGESIACLESFRQKSLRLERSPIDPWISWVTL